MGKGSYGPIEVFRSGTFTPMEGKTATITERELQEIAASYDPALHPSPVVIGHPKTDDPAYGWVDRIYVEGGKLKATLKETVSEFADLVKEGRYKKVSISLFLPNSPANPKPGTTYLKHVGFLGAASPAVPGLKPVQFSNDQQGTIEFQQDAPTVASFSDDERQELEALRREKYVNRLDKLVDEGRILPAFMDEVVEFVGSLDGTETLSFADGEQTTRRDWFLSYLARQPKVVSFGAYDIGKEPLLEKVAKISVPDGYTVDTAQNDLYLRAREIEREKGISFADAVEMARER